ncbi:hypothetical protein K503DRAFT_810887, partial [Rhizopogon vinicolor AM-OR11-026]
GENCCNKRILEHQPDFCDRKSLVQEVIEAAGHLCIFSSKFYCELNFIEFFWDVVKKYFRDKNYTFATLKENMPKALASNQPRRSTNPFMGTWYVQVDGWMEIGFGPAPQKLKCRSRHLVLASTSPIDVFQIL